MRMVKYNPLRDLQNIEQNMDNFLTNSWDLIPALTETSSMDLYEEDGNLIAEVSLPNFKKEEVKVTTNEGVLEITAEHKEEYEKKNSRHYYIRESTNLYFRRVTLPKGATADKADATFKDGLLKIVVPIAEVKKESQEVLVK